MRLFKSLHLFPLSSHWTGLIWQKAWWSELSSLVKWNIKAPPCHQLIKNGLIKFGKGQNSIEIQFITPAYLKCNYITGVDRFEQGTKVFRCFKLAESWHRSFIHSVKACDSSEVLARRVVWQPWRYKKWFQVSRMKLNWDITLLYLCMWTVRIEVKFQR